MIIGLVLNQTLIQTREEFRDLNIQEVELDYENCKNRVIIIDESGVVPLVAKGDKFNQTVNDKFLNYLNEISRDKRN